VLIDEGFEAVRRSAVGAPNAPDEDIMGYAMQNGFIVFTNDSDYGTLLALSPQAKPSVVQVRTKDVLPEAIGHIVLTLLQRFSSELNDGAIVTVDIAKPRVRILPLR
jgi:predicted nuclease of predicted toxin-antitoxin system